jgi:hypothetical protein
MGQAQSLLTGLFPFPHFGDGGSGSIYFVFEGDACVVEAGKLRRCSSEEEHSAVAHRASWAEFTHARPLPRSCFSIGCHFYSLAIAMEGSICADYRCVCAHAGDGDSQYGAAVFKRDFRSGGLCGENRLTSLLPVVIPICSPSIKSTSSFAGVRGAGLTVRKDIRLRPASVE